MTTPKVSLGNHAKVWLEHWFYGTALTALATSFLTLIQSGKHDYVNVTYSLVLGLLLPLIEKMFPKSALNKISNATGIPEPLIQNVANTVQTKLVEDITKLIPTGPTGTTGTGNTGGAGPEVSSLPETVAPSAVTP